MKTKMILLYLSFSICAQSQESLCQRITNFGDVQLCLPTIETYQECYMESGIKELADAAEVPINEVLGFYIDDSTYHKKDQIDNIQFDNYFKIYGTKEIQYENITKIELNQTYDLLKSNFIITNWDSIVHELDKTGLQIDIGVPTKVDDYRITDESFTIILLVKYQISENDFYTMAMTINGMLINKRMIWMAYYLEFEGKTTIEKLKINSNKILDKILESNE